MSVTSIEWTKRPGTIGETWNPTTGCNKVDRGCKNCYAEIMHKRLQAMGHKKYQRAFLAGAVEQWDTLDIPMKWNKPRTVFVNSMSDLFHADLDFKFISEVFQVIQLTPQHTYLVLTKRPEIALKFWHWQGTTNGTTWTPPANLWLGTSANDQKSADLRLPQLLAITDVAVRFLSYEPATGPLDLSGYLSFPKYNALDWVICGGESGPKAEKMWPEWPRKVRDQCVAAGVPFFFKQWGTWAPNGPAQIMMKLGKTAGGHILDGETWQQFPNLEPATV